MQVEVIGTGTTFLHKMKELLFLFAASFKVAIELDDAAAAPYQYDRRR